jgi:hypothetical protein
VRFLLGDEDHLSKPYNGAIYIFILTSSICLHFTYEWKHSLPSLFTGHWRKHYFHLYSLHAEEKRRPSVFTSYNTLTSICLQKARKHLRPSIINPHSKETLTSIFLHSLRQRGTLKSICLYRTADREEHRSQSVSTVVQTARNTKVHLSLPYCRQRGTLKSICLYCRSDSEEH